LRRLKGGRSGAHPKIVSATLEREKRPHKKGRRGKEKGRRKKRGGGESCPSLGGEKGPGFELGGGKVCGVSSKRKKKRGGKNLRCPCPGNEGERVRRYGEGTESFFERIPYSRKRSPAEKERKRMRR